MCQQAQLRSNNMQNISNYILDPTTVPDYIAGEAVVVFTVDKDTYLYATGTDTAALTVKGFVEGDSVTIVNNGYIIGKGGDGASAGGSDAGPSNGGPAIDLYFPITIHNFGVIAGGGGGGAGNKSCGGGGAGGGKGGSWYGADVIRHGGEGGDVGQVGKDGEEAQARSGEGSGAGGGGRLPFGSGGLAGGYAPSNAGCGGESGGGGAGVTTKDKGICAIGGNGGHHNHMGENAPALGDLELGGGGGGGGWGASGGAAGAGLHIHRGTSGAVGGKAINLNTHTVCINGAGVTYGAIC